MKVIRTFHPIGQGAFYTERFILGNGKEVNIVYDCGTQCKRIINKEIRSYFAPMMHKIDILFISHFDDDHVNGIEELLKQGIAIGNVVIPYYDNNICLKAYVLANPTLNKLLSSNITKVIQVKPIISGTTTEISEASFIERLRNEIESLTPITTSGLNSLWVFIPLYYGDGEMTCKLSKALSERFKENFNFKDLENPQFINKHKKEINNAYNSVYCRNVYSMMLYSGLLKDEESIVTKVYHKNSLLGNDMLRPNRNNHEACLYTGDASFNNIRIGDTETYLGNDLINRIGLLQIPHHGSISNICIKELSKLSIYSPNTLLFTSFGINSQYNHPSLRVVEDAMVYDSQFIGIDEQRENAYIEEIVLANK